MKPTPQHNIPVTVRHQVWEKDPAVAPFYKGIFSATLNFTVDVMFVPHVARHPWPPVLPGDIDNIGSKREARHVILAFSQYIVTPDATRAGQEELIEQTWDEEPRAGVLYYVTSREFKVFSMELAALDEEMTSIHDYRNMSELADRAFVTFLVSRVLTSRHFREADLHIVVK